MKTHYLIYFLILNCMFLHAKDEDFKEIEFPTHLTSDVQEEFLKGVWLLHNFQYVEAREMFLDLQKKDPDFAMGYWGEAMTYNHPMWNEQNLTAAQHALNKLGSTPEERVAKGRNAKEKGFIQAVNILYAPGDDKRKRDWGYAQHLYDLHKQFPLDNEVAAFYALSLLGKEEGARDFGEYMKAASIAQEVIFRNARHPGGLHYFIHSVDDPIHAPLGLHAARRYSQVAHDSPHALHMPSHIYFALGLWKDVVASNQKAWDAGLQSNTPVYDLHILQWLQYGYLELGDYRKARVALDTIYNLAVKYNDLATKDYYFQMLAAQGEKTDDFTNLPPLLPFQDMDLTGFAKATYVASLINLNKSEEVDSLIHHLKQKYQLGISANPQENLNYVQLIILQLQALNARKKGTKEQAYTLLKEAIDLEKRMPMNIGPPIPSKPSEELLGNFYLEDNDYSKACEAYQHVLSVWHNRRQTLEKLKQFPAESRCIENFNIFYHPDM